MKSILMMCLIALALPMPGRAAEKLICAGINESGQFYKFELVYDEVDFVQIDGEPYAMLTKDNKKSLAKLADMVCRKEPV